MWPVDPTTGWVAIDREGRGDAGVTVAFGVVHETAETLLPLVGLPAEALAADVRETQSCDCLWLMLVDDFGILGGKRVAIRQTMWNKGRELISRVRAGRCELCEQKAEMHVHHVRALADHTQPGRPQPAWAQLMAKRRRKTLVVCRPCHDIIHAWPPTATPME